MNLLPKNNPKLKRKINKLKKEYPLGSLVDVWEWNFTADQKDWSSYKTHSTGLIVGYSNNITEKYPETIDLRLIVLIEELFLTVSTSKCTTISRPYRRL